MTKDVVIVNTGCANLASVRFAFDRLGVKTFVTDNRNEIESADRLIFPGVGSAAAGMRSIEQKGLAGVLRSSKQPVLGICLGMQILAEHSDEGNTECLGVVRGSVQELKIGKGEVLPHMGWNTVSIRGESELFDGLSPDERYYFVHSYALPVSDVTIAEGQYGSKFSAAVKESNFYGVQFHPERSGSAGARLLQNFLQLES